MDPVSYAVLPGKENVVILRIPTLAALGINVYDMLGECARKRNLSVQGVESPNSKGFRRVSIAVEALLQGGPGAPGLPDEVVELLVSRGPGVRRGCARSRIGTGVLFGAAFVVIPLLVSSR